MRPPPGRWAGCAIRRAQPALERASGDARTEVRAWALLGLGRLPDPPLALIQRTALDRRRRLGTAARGPGRAGHDRPRRRSAEQAGTASPAAALVPLTAASDRGVASCAALALSAVGPRPAPCRPLWRAALLGDRFARRQAYGCCAACPTGNGDAAGGPAPGRGHARRRLGAARGPVLDELCDDPAARSAGGAAARWRSCGSNTYRRSAACWQRRLAGQKRRGRLQALAAMPRLPDSARRDLYKAVEKPLGWRLADADWRLRVVALHAAARLDDPRVSDCPHRLGAGRVARWSHGRSPPAGRTAIAAALRGLRAQGRLDPGALSRALAPLLDRPGLADPAAGREDAGARTGPDTGAAPPSGCATPTRSWSNRHDHADVRPTSP